MRLSVLVITFFMFLPTTILADQFRVLFDQGHGQLFFIDQNGSLDLSDLATTFQRQGFDVAGTKQPLTEALLADIDALIISGAFQSPTQSEIRAIENFLISGGKLAVMLHVGPLVAPLLDQLGVAVSRAVIHDTLLGINGKATDFPVKSLAGHKLFSLMTEFNAYGAWALQARSPNVKKMALTSPSAWLDMQRNQVRGSNPQGRFPIVLRGEIGQGEFLIFGDDAIFQNRFLTGNNLQLGQNLAAWMMPGQ